ncbi:hypothetical protein CRUP_020429 [Coryphaenoides rupestris]|nr:hypothetical protein CRUP_020429 [Coryphaenoides rupestris]
MRDTNDHLVAMTLQSLAVLVPLLGAQVVVGGERTKVFKRTSPNFTKSTEVTPETIGREMSLPLNGFSQSRELESLTSSPDQPETRAVQRDDWPDWSDAEEGEKRESGQPVQIHIQASERAPPAKLPLAPRLVEEEPWDDFEDGEAASDVSPTAPSPDPIVLTAPAAAGGQSPVAPLKLTVGSSTALKQSSSPQASTHSSFSSSWDNGWSEEDKDLQKSPPNALSKFRTKGTAPRRINGGSVGGLGEEFTIEVRRRPDRDPELDLFADMVPDIKMSSPTLVLPGDGGFTDSGLFTAGRHSEPTQPSDAVTITGKFAATETTETEAEGWGDGDDLNWEDENAW